MTGGISVVIPAFKAARFIAQTVASAREAGATEIVVVDDGSPDETAAVAEAAGATVLRRPNGGVSRARNAGLAVAAEPFLCFLDADDLLRPGALTAMRDVLVARPEVAGVFGGVGYITADGAPHPTLSAGRVLPETVTLPEIMVTNFIDTPGAVLLRTAEVRDVGGFVPELLMGEEWELWLKLARRGPFVSVPRTVLDYRQHEMSSTRKASFGMETFEPALRLVFRPERWHGLIEPAALRRYELHHRATLYRFIYQRGRVARSLGGFALLLVRSRLDPFVARLAARTLAATALRPFRRR